MVLAELFASLAPVVALFATVTMLVLRAGASRIFFDVVGSFQATRLIGDAQAKMTVLQGLVLDGLSGITEGVGLIGEQLNAVVDSTVPLAQEIGYARIEFEKFVQAGDDATLLSQQIEELGHNFGYSADQALAAGAKMAQLSSVVGGGAAIPAATEVGIAFGMVGGMETEEAMKRLIALQQQTTFMYGGLTQAQFRTLSAQKQVNLVRQESVGLLNQLNTIENRSSATMAQITMVMNQFASSAKLAGDEVSYMAAMSATLIEAGEEQGKAGRALKMMYARLGADTGNNSEILRKYGIETKDANGQLRSMHDILQDISAIYPQLANNHRLEIAQAVAGNDHYVRAIKLMEGYNRTVELNTMAIQELDTAQDELNKRFEDNAFLLTQAEAKLKDAKAALGEQFAPSVIKATNLQARMNESMAEFIEYGRGVRGLGTIIEGAMDFTQYARFYAPFVEANLNIMSLNVSLQTQMQIQRALTGQDLVRASAYGKQGSLLRANLSTIQAQANIEDRRALIQASMLRMDKNALGTSNANLQVSQGELTNNRQALMMTIEANQAEVKRLQTKQNELGIMKALNPVEAQRRQEQQAQLGLEQATLQAEKDGLRVLTTEQAYAKAKSQYDSLELKTVQQLMAYKKGHFIHAKAEALMQESVQNHFTQQLTLAGQIIEKKRQSQQLQIGLTASETKQLNALQERVKLAQQELASEGQRHINHLIAAQAIGGETQAAKILRNAHIELIAITQQKSSAEVQNNAIMEQAELAARQLAMAYGLTEAELRDLIPKMQIFRNALDMVDEQSKATVQTGMALNNVLMKGTGILGAYSMAFGMLGDDAKAAKLSMFFLNLSMIPMTVQMLVSTAQSYQLATGFTTAGAAANYTTAAVSGLNKALKLMGVGLAIGLVGYLAYKLMPDATEETDNLSTAFENMSATAIYTGEAYKSMAQSLADSTLADIADMRLSKEEQIAQITADMAGITEPALLRIKQDQLKAAKDELATLEQIQAVRQAQDLSENVSEAQKFFDLVKNAQDAEGEYLKQQEKGKGFVAGIMGFGEKYLAESLIEGAGGAFGLEYETHEELVKRLGKDAADAYAQIPEEMQGAVIEAAKYATDFDDFLAILERDFQEFGDDDNLFGGFGDNINDNFIGPLEAAKNAAFEFGNAREEMFFGMAKGNITGDMVKQVVNKGVETLINTTEVIMTNNFTGMTTTQAANEITKQVVVQLNGLGLNIQQP
jgi:TP901 family phage tail tape measure protein